MDEPCFVIEDDLNLKPEAKDLWTFVFGLCLSNQFDCI